LRGHPRIKSIVHLMPSRNRPTRTVSGCGGDHKQSPFAERLFYAGISIHWQPGRDGKHPGYFEKLAALSQSGNSRRIKKGPPTMEGALMDGSYF